MSIINQALQKVQREQLLQGPHEMSYLLAGQRRRASRRAWLMLSLGCGVGLGLGWLVYAWLTPVRSPVPAVPEWAWTTQALAPATEPGLPARPEVLASVPNSGVPREVVPAAPSAEAPGLQPPTAAPVMVLAVEGRSAPLPVPRVMPMPLPIPAAASPPPVEEPPSPAESGSEAASLDSVRGQVLVQRGLAAQESGDLKRALLLLEQAVKLDPTAKTAYNSLGNVYFQQKRFPQAVSMYHKALTLDPDYAKARNNLGSAYIQLAMYDKAIEELQRALRSDGNSSLAYYNLACVYARTGDSATAVQYLQQAIALEPQARDWARTDADFTRVRNTPEVQQLLEP